MREKTPDQIRRSTTPKKYYGFVYGFLGGLIGVTVWFGGWMLLHQEQVRRYPEYCANAIKVSVGHLSLFGKRQPQGGMDREELRYDLLRYGNEDHSLDAEILRHRWYPKDTRNPRAWVYANGALKPLFSEPAALVFKWPIVLTLLTFLGAAIWGMVEDYRYQTKIIAGVPFDGSLVATVEEYEREVKGDGMRYAIAPWKDR